MRFVQHEQHRGIKNTTLDKRIRLIKDVVKLASANYGFPMPTYKIELKDDEADVRPYTTDELNQLFRLLSNQRKIREWQYWAVLVALFSGLRREEVVSLRVRDVKQQAGILVFDVVDAKSPAGVRNTPVSEFLVRLGFLDFVQQRQETEEEYLFMCHLPAPKCEYAPVPVNKFGDFFKNSLRKKIKVELKPNEKKTLHSLRHNFADALKQGGVASEMRDDLCGHASRDASKMRKTYDEIYLMGMRREAVNQARWDCDFSLLRSYRP